MPQSRQPAASMFTDIVGYKVLMDNNKQKVFELLTNRKRIQQLISKAHDGELKVETKEARPDDPVGRGKGTECIIHIPIKTNY